MKDSGRIKSVMDKAIEQAVAAVDGRVDAYEVYVAFNRGKGVESKGLKADSIKVRSGFGVGLRTLKSARPGFSFTTVTNEAAIKKMADDALTGSIGASEDEFIVFPKAGSAREADLGLTDASFDDTTDEKIIDTAVCIEREARDYDKRITRVRKASYGENYACARLVNSSGVDVFSEATFYSGSVMAVAEEAGISEMGWDADFSHKRGGVDCAFVGRSAAERAVEMLGAKTMGTIKCKAVFENTIVIEFLEALSSSFLGDNVVKGKSMLKDKLGKKVASSIVSIYDDGLMPGGWGSSLYDSEGVPRIKTALIKDGMCETFLYDSYWARRAGKASTGSAGRGGFKGSPYVTTSNLYMEKGSVPFDELLKGMGKGLIIKSILGAHTIDSVSGDFSLGASGLWVEDGKVAYPVRGMAIAGNLIELFSSVEAVGSDMRLMGSTGAPSVLVGSIEASGA
ncbi:MAG: TldD/PmbA family protein [Deltaproteobacteria bacterium]|nr:TldD/PmbA family protein [Deltaproteobacteria bacterium]